MSVTKIHSGIDLFNNILDKRITYSNKSRFSLKFSRDSYKYLKKRAFSTRYHCDLYLSI